MLVFTSNGRLGYVTSQADGFSQVLLFEEYSVQEYPTSELRVFALEPAPPSGSA